MTVESLSNGKIELIITEAATEIIINTTPPIISGGTADHSQLENLDFEHSGHTGFEPARTDNQNYITDEQLIDIAKIPDKVDKVTGKGLISDEITSRLSYNANEDTLSYTRTDGGTREFGKEMSDRYTNLDTVPIVNGDIVSVVGATGNRSAIKLTDASNQSLSLATIGMVTVTSIAVNNSGEVAKAGKVHELNTLAYSEGTVLYVHPTNKGKWTATKPTSGYIIKIGVVVVSHATEGIIDLEINVLPQAKDIITDSDNRFVTDTEKQKITDSAIDTEVFHKSTANEIGQLDQKDTLVNDDVILLEDSENGFIKVKTTLQKIRDFFKATYDTVYSKLSGGNIFSGVQSMLDGIKITKVYPNTDGTTAIQFTKADGSTVVLIIDTTNGRLGVGKTPTQPLDVNGQGLFSGAIITSSGNGVQSNKLNTYSSNVDLLLTTSTAGRIVYTDRVFKAAGYQSSDGSAGATGSFTSADGKTITIKNGLITSIV